jgi:MFS superfamily sulfate permease-like transporter
LDPESGIATIKYKNLKEGPESPRRIKGMILIRFEEGLFFGNVGQLKEKLKRIELHGDLGIHPGEDPIEVDFEEDSCLDGIREEPTNPLTSVIFDMKAVSSLDAR